MWADCSVSEDCIVCSLSTHEEEQFGGMLLPEHPHHYWGLWIHPVNGHLQSPQPVPHPAGEGRPARQYCSVFVYSLSESLSTSLLQVSYFASCACLSDKHQFPYFFRTIPSDVYQANALARLVKHFGWTWVGTMGADDAYGRTGIDLFTNAVTQLGVCVAYRVIIPKLPTQQQLQDIVKTIRDSTARVLVVFAIEEDIKPVVDEIIRQNVTGKQWVASEAWVTSTLISTEENYPSLSGTIGFAIRRAEIPGFKQFLESVQPLAEPYNAFAREFWETQFQCSLNTTLPAPSTTEQVHYSHSCTGTERVQDIHSIYNDVSELRVTYNMHKAVYAVAHALHNLLQCQREKGSGLTQQCPDIHNLQPWQVQQFMRFLSHILDFNGNIICALMISRLLRS